MQKERANIGSLPWVAHKSTREVKTLQVAQAFAREEGPTIVVMLKRI